MYVRVRSEAVDAMAPTLLGDYRSPYTGARGADNPTVFAGFVVSNSETGCGAFTITPRLVVQICNNGMTLTADALRAIHLGTRLEQGPIRWTTDTQHRATELVTAQARDAVNAFLNVDYVRRQIAQLERHAVAPIADPAAAVEHVSCQLRFTEDQQATILAHFIKGGDSSAGGVLHAVTSAAQTLTDADTAHDMENLAVRAMHLAATTPTRH